MPRSPLPMMMARQPSSPPADEPLSIRVVRAIAAHDGVDPVDLSPPLYASIDPAALDSLFEPTSPARPGERVGSLTFDYDGKQVTVGADGEITIDSSPETDRSSRRSI